MSAATLDRVILSYPTAVNLTDTRDVAAPRSWIQLARVGKFVSKRYGRFEINRADLAQMYRNFTEVTPKAPTELPVDYDHLGMDPKHPLDGIAAGWIKRLELRANGDELWAEVEWTPKAAEAIKNREYRFVSPSFVKNHTHKDGTTIGTTLLAAALTNHPFLESMRAVTLATSTIQAMNLDAPLRDLVAVEDGVLSLSKVGQRVSIEQADELTPEVRGMTFVIADVRGEGDDAFVFLKTPEGKPFGWFRAEQLAPARAQNHTPSTPEKREGPMKREAGERIMMRAQEIARERQINLARAVKVASGEDEAVSREYLQHPQAMAEPSPVINLRREDGETFAELVSRTAREQRMDLRAATRLVSENFPALAEAYERDVI